MGMKEVPKFQFCFPFGDYIRYKVMLMKIGVENEAVECPPALSSWFNLDATFFIRGIIST